MFYGGRAAGSSPPVSVRNDDRRPLVAGRNTSQVVNSGSVAASSLSEHKYSPRLSIGQIIVELSCCWESCSDINKSIRATSASAEKRKSHSENFQPNLQKSPEMGRKYSSRDICA